MHKISTEAIVENGELMIRMPAPAGTSEGRHLVEVYLPTVAYAQPGTSIFDRLRPIATSGWAAGSTFSRAEIYDDDGR